MIRINDNLSKILGDNSRNPRLDNWLWLYLPCIGAAQYDYMSLNKRTMRDIIANNIVSTKISPQILLDAARDSLIPENLLAWITDSKRQHEWIKSKLSQMNISGIPMPQSLEGREHILALIDTLNVNFKSEFIAKNIQKAWIEQLRKDEQLEWIKEKDEREACAYIWDWMYKNHPSRLGGHTEPTDHQGMLIFFDSVHMTELEKKQCISLARKNWRQNNRRKEPNGKKQYNFILSDRAINRLDELCNKHEISRTQAIEILLKMEQEKGLYIEEWLRILREIEK